MAKSINITLKKGFQLDAEALPDFPISEQILEFKGDKDNPFLAPRGVFLCGNKLIVADTGQNRVFIWNQLPTNEFQSPDVVLGQTQMHKTSRNQGGDCHAGSLMYPSGLWSDGDKLIVADAWNHRVLIWHAFPTENGQKADVVVGQADFDTNMPNQTGLSDTTNAQSLYWPYGVCSDGEKLWIADTGNRRCLVYHQIPTENNAKADAVIGKDHFEARDFDNQNAIWPYSIKLSKNGKLAITDTQYFRVLLWQSSKDSLMHPSDSLIGQSHLEASGANQFELFPRSNTLNWVYDTVFYKNGIFVADTGNSRILWFENVPTSSNANANHLIGKNNFNTGSEFADTRLDTSGSLYWPFSISVSEEASLMAIADTGNHRILLHQLGV